MTTSPAALWTPDECAAFLSTSTDMLKKWRYEKKGPPYFKQGRSVRYHPGQVARWLRARAVGIEPVHTIGKPLNVRTTP